MTLEAQTYVYEAWQWSKSEYIAISDLNIGYPMCAPNKNFKETFKKNL